MIKVALVLRSGQRPGENVAHALVVSRPSVLLPTGSGDCAAITGSWRRCGCAVVAAAGLTSLSGILDPLSVLVARVCALIAVIAVSVTKPRGHAGRSRRDGQAVARTRGFIVGVFPVQEPSTVGYADPVVLMWSDSAYG